MEEILNNWLQEKPKDKFDKELHKYTYYDLMEFAEHYHTLQLQQTGVVGRSEQLVCCENCTHLNKDEKTCGETCVNWSAHNKAN